VRLVGHIAEDKEHTQFCRKTRHICDDNIKTYLKEMAWERVDCSGQGTVLGIFERGNKLLGSIIFREFLLTS
jgi:hypothetical protein